MARETLSKDQIVRAAVELLDSEGIDGLSMRRLGKRLGSAATAMYWHVASKESLVVLAADAVWGELKFPDPAEVGWRAAARALVHDTYALGKRHPWLVPAISSHFVYGHGMARFQDHSYAIYEAAGFKGWELDWAVNSAFTFVTGTLLVDATEATLATAQVPRGKGDEAKPALSVADWAYGIASQYPRLLARIEEQRGTDPAAMTSEKFEFGVEAILDGLEARLGGADPRP
ncbi:TetR/AcrR family transcriptional regulator C-terminal domain-containing protein [Streptomyces sp. P9(2023)]|uniref:TetR/AcrR family transcriptional regulator n=1 Tax=Streptomyces sp. P9(2023) TaxID=3064394 RepID=UPI0028F445B7|nr:TetR/AcrR family transcriptional regulator C-terminal domain-containing protein [Streptomyces sp. P9(2023)]MDT9693051.1 TetR/AcrR family transcriptional regulator C-terminal domain-containing protein [Streptomyces sp. P9(2023)]